MGKFKKGDKVFITTNAQAILGLEDGIEYTIVDILTENLDYPIVVNAKEFGKDWVQFFSKNELIKII